MNPEFIDSLKKLYPITDGATEPVFVYEEDGFYYKGSAVQCWAKIEKLSGILGEDIRPLPEIIPNVVFYNKKIRVIWTDQEDEEGAIVCYLYLPRDLFD